MNVAATPVMLLTVISGVPLNPVAVPVTLPTNPPAVANPLILIPPAPVIPYPTGTSAPNVNCGAPLPALLVKYPALILPPDPDITSTPSVDNPNTSGIKSSPSDTIKSQFSCTSISAY